MAVTTLLALTPGRTPAGASAAGWTAYFGGNLHTITPFNTATNTTGNPIGDSTIANQTAIAISPDGSTAYVTDEGPFALTPVNTATGAAGASITINVGAGSQSGAAGVAVSPNGATVYVLNSNNGTLSLVNTATHSYLTRYSVGTKPTAIAISPNGSTAYVFDNDSTTLTSAGDISVVSLATGAITNTIALTNLDTGNNPFPYGPYGIAISPDGSHVWVVQGTDQVSVVNTTTGNVNTVPLPMSNDAAAGVAVSPDGSTVWVTSNLAGMVYAFNAASMYAPPNPVPKATISLGENVYDVAVSPDGRAVYVAEQAAVQVIDAATGTAGTAIPIATGSSVAAAAVAIVPDQPPKASLKATTVRVGGTTSFDASASSVAVGSIASYVWAFGDGSSAITATPNTTHVYKKAGTFTASVTETSSAGTSTTHVFTGRTMLRNGGPSASASVEVVVTALASPVSTTSKATSTTAKGASTTTSTTAPLKNQVTTTTTTAPAKRGHPGTHSSPVAAPAHPRPGPLGEIPPSGTPGMAVTLMDQLPARTCPGGTVYVFFDSQLVAQGPEQGHEFTDSGVEVPGDTSPGWHHFELNCTDVDPWIQSARFEVLASANHPMGWVTSLPRAGHVTFDGRTLLQSGALALGLLLLVVIYLMGFPGELFNRTYESNKERLAAAARRRLPGYFEEREEARLWRRVAMAAGLFVAFVAVAGFINALLDPKFGLNRSSAWLFLGWCAGIVIVTLGFQLPAIILGVRTRRAVGLHILVGSLLIAAVCVGISRALHLEPGYCYGLLAVFAFRPAIEERMTGRLAAFSALCVLLLSLVAWVIWIPVQQAAAHPHPGPALLVVETMLGVVFLAGIQSVVFGMLPLPFLPGREVASWNKLAWLGIFGLGLFVFSWTLLQPGSGYPSEVHHLDIVPVAVTCAAFALVTVAFMLYFRLRRRPDSSEPDSDAGTASGPQPATEPAT